jgi:hypothetical protein
MRCECEREQDVLDALAAGRWPDRCNEELRLHVSACAICRDLADVATVLVGDQDAAWRDARVPPAGVVWWRAQLRAREDAARAAGRPVAFIQGVAASAAVWLVIALFRAIPVEYVSEWRTWFVSLLPNATLTMADVSRVTATLPLIVFLIVGAWLLLAPLAIYLAAADE